MKAKFHIMDIIMYMVFAIAIILSLLLIPKPSDTLSVKAGDAEYAFSLNENGIYSVEGPLGTTTIEIRDKRARIIDSPCPNKTCVASSWSKTLVCLPNRVIATANSKDEGGIDATSS